MATKHIQAWIDPRLHAKFRKMLVDKDISIQEWVKDAITKDIGGDINPVKHSAESTAEADNSETNGLDDNSFNKLLNNLDKTKNSQAVHSSEGFFDFAGGNPTPPEKPQTEKSKDILKKYTSYGKPSQKTKQPERVGDIDVNSLVGTGAVSPGDIIKRARSKGMAFFDHKYYYACLKQYGLHPEELSRTIDRINFPDGALKDLKYADRYFRKGLILKEEQGYGYLRDRMQ